MNIFCWNCRGAGKAAAVRDLHDFARQFTPTLLCIVETQIESARVEVLAGTLGFDNSYDVSSQGRSGGIGLFWSRDVTVELKNYNVNHIDVLVHNLDQNSLEWRFTGWCRFCDTDHDRDWKEMVREKDAIKETKLEVGGIQL